MKYLILMLFLCGLYSCADERTSCQKLIDDRAWLVHYYNTNFDEGYEQTLYSTDSLIVKICDCK